MEETLNFIFYILQKNCKCHILRDPGVCLSLFNLLKILICLITFEDLKLGNLNLSHLNDLSKFNAKKTLIFYFTVLPKCTSDK
jgi:hypothetical protein